MDAPVILSFLPDLIQIAAIALLAVFFCYCVSVVMREVVKPTPTPPESPPAPWEVDGEIDAEMDDTGESEQDVLWRQYTALQPSYEKALPHGGLMYSVRSTDRAMVLRFVRRDSLVLWKLNGTGEWSQERIPMAVVRRFVQ